MDSWKCFLSAFSLYSLFAHAQGKFRKTASLYSAISFLIEIFISGRPAALEASDFPELSGLLATSCSDQQSRLLFKSTVPRHGWPCDSRGITHHNPMPPGMQVPTLYFPPSKNAIATEGSGIPHTLERLVYFNCWHIIWWSMIHNFIWAYLQTN